MFEREWDDKNLTSIYNVVKKMGKQKRWIIKYLLILSFFFLYIIENLRIILKIMFGSHFYFLFLKFNSKKLY